MDDAAAQAAIYVAQYALMATDYVLFASEEVIFDTAASKSVYSSRIQASSPMSLLVIRPL